MAVILPSDEGVVRLDDYGGTRSISVEPAPGVFVPRDAFTTVYPLDLIEHVHRVKGAAYLCDEIARDEDPRYVQLDFEWDILSYVSAEEFRGRRILDFGCGSGASTMVLARMFSESAIVGVELSPAYAGLARARAEFYGFGGRVDVRISPDPDSLPAGIGEFDFVLLSAVYEHMLPGERGALLTRLWARLKPGGLMFLDQTPHRWFPVEMHTTGLPLINYFPDALAHWFACHVSKRVSKHASWPELLRAGIRGATSPEVLQSLNRGGEVAELIEPSRNGVRDRIELWRRLAGAKRMPLVKNLFAAGFRVVKAVSGVEIVPSLSLAIRKVR